MSIKVSIISADDDCNQPLTRDERSGHDGAVPRELDLVTLADFGQMAGVSRQRAWQLASREDFPKPAAVLGTGRVWRRRDLERWIEGWDRSPGRPPKRRRRRADA
jgi:prophage regulatory protein